MDAVTVVLASGSRVTCPPEVAERLHGTAEDKKPAAKKAASKSDK